MTEQIQEIIVAISPYIITVITMIIYMIKMLTSFKSLKKDVYDMKEIKTTNDQMRLVLEENYELKRKLNELLTKIDHVERK